MASSPMNSEVSSETSTRTHAARRRCSEPARDVAVLALAQCRRSLVARTPSASIRSRLFGGYPPRGFLDGAEATQIYKQ